MLRRFRSVAGAALVAFAALLVLSAPAGAQQLVDAGKEGDGSGGLAFVIMVFTDIMPKTVGALRSERLGLPATAMWCDDDRCREHTRQSERAEVT